MGPLVPGWIGRIVIIRSHRLGHTPVRHGQPGIEFGGMLKRARRLVVIESVDEPQTLIEELLRLRIFGGDRMVKIAQSGHQRDGTGLSMGGMILGRSEQAREHPAHHNCQRFHLVDPPVSIFPTKPSQAPEKSLWHSAPCKRQLAYAKLERLAKEEVRHEKSSKNKPAFRLSNSTS